MADNTVAANFTTKKTLLGINRRRKSQGKPPIKQGPKSSGLSRIQLLYAAGGLLDTASIAIGTIGRASAIRAKGKFEEAAFSENERRLKLAADDAKKRGDKDATNFMKRVRGMQGAQRAALGASGIEIDRGTAAQIQAETLEFGIEDRSTIKVNAIREAFGFKRQALEQESKVQLTRIGRKLAEKQAKTAGTLQAVQSITATAGSLSKAGTARTT